MEHFRGEYLAEMRETAQLTQIEAAERLGISRAHLARLESDGISGIDRINDHVAALGGRLDFIVTLGDRSWRVPGIFYNAGKS